VLKQGQKARELKFSGPPHEVARALVGSLEGAMMLARSFGEVSRFETAANRSLAELFR
jgi:TetR/AcrR family transcriptional regulator, transcriptional repressor for nem operon